MPSALCPPGQQVELQLGRSWCASTTAARCSRSTRASPAADAPPAPSQRLFEGPLPWAKLRQGHKLLRLAERYSPARLDAACRRALEVDLGRERILVESSRRPRSVEPPPGRFARPGAVFALARRPRQEPHDDATTAELRPLLKRLKLGPMLDTLPERIALDGLDEQISSPTR